MHNVVPVLKALAATNSKLAKLDILKNLSGQQEDVVKEYLRLGCSTSITYGVNTTTLNGIDTSPFGANHINFTEVRNLTTLLADRQLTGDSAIRAIRELFIRGNADDIYWIKALLSRKLRIGLDAKIINEVWPGLIWESQFALAKKAKSDAQFKSGWIVEPKFDGFRAIAIHDEWDGWQFFSRENNLYNNTETAAYQLEGKVPTDYVYDGELLADNWNLTDSIVHTVSTHPSRHTLRFFIFDIIPKTLWLNANQSGTDPLLDRKTVIKRIFDTEGRLSVLPSIFNTDYDNIKVVAGNIYDDSETINKLAASYLESGFEGAVVKQADSPYPFKRSSNWLKIKFEDTVDAKIIDAMEGEGKYTGMLGSLVVDVNGASVKVGGGYSDSQRDSFWRDRNKLIGRTLEFKVQKDPQGAIDIVARFPVFVRFRDDK